MTRKRKFPTNAKSHFKRLKHSDGGASKLEVGMQGVLVSHDRNKEQFCRMDCFRLLNHFGDMLYGKEKIEEENQASDESDGEDIEKALSTEVNDIKGGLQRDSLKKRRFFSVKSGCNNLIFVRFKGASPSELMKAVVESIFNCDDLENSDIPSIKNVLRVHPVELSCSAYLDNMCKNIPPFVESKLSAFPDSDVKEYTIEYKRRNNSHLSRETVLEGLVNVLRDSPSGWKYNCRSQSVSVIIDVLKTVCLVSVVRDYYKYKKYNIRELLLQCRKSDKPLVRDGEQSSERETCLAPTVKNEEGLPEPAPQISVKNSEAANKVRTNLQSDANSKEGPSGGTEQPADSSLSPTINMHEKRLPETVSIISENYPDSTNNSELPAPIQTDLHSDKTSKEPNISQSNESIGTAEEHEGNGVDTENVDI